MAGQGRKTDTTFTGLSFKDLVNEINKKQEELDPEEEADWAMIEDEMLRDLWDDSDIEEDEPEELSKGVLKSILLYELGDKVAHTLEEWERLEKENPNLFQEDDVSALIVDYDILTQYQNHEITWKEVIDLHKKINEKLKD